MFKGTITFIATGKTQDEVIEKILFDLHEEIRREGEGIKIEEINPNYEQWYEENKHNDSVQRLYRGVVENDPDYSLTFSKWCRKYYQECVDI